MNGLDPVVTGVGVITPWTNDPAAARAVAGRLAPPDDSWFDPAAHLGPRGYRYLPPACRYLLAAARRATTTGLAAVPEDDRGAVVATNHAATAVLSTMDITVTGSGAAELSPAVAPFFAINVYATRLSTEHGVKGFTATVTSPGGAGLDAIAIAIRTLRLGRGRAVLAAATEAAPGSAAAEAGAVVLVLEPRVAAAARDARIAGRCRVTNRYVDTTPASLAGLARAARGLVGERPIDVDVVGPASPRTAAVCDALGAVRHVPAGAGCLAAALVVAGVLAERAARLVVAAGDGPVTLAYVEGEPA